MGRLHRVLADRSIVARSAQNRCVENRRWLLLERSLGALARSLGAFAAFCEIMVIICHVCHIVHNLPLYDCFLLELQL